METAEGTTMTEDTDSRVVVGVDGSPSSIEALRWAARYSELSGETLHVVTAWAYPDQPTPFGVVPDLPLPPDPSAEARKRLDDTITEVLGPERSRSVLAEVRAGHAAAVLLDTSRGAEVLVVGSRGRSAFKGTLLGSVSEHCVHHARCPVVVVHSFKGPAS
jgi:nucleotide-binding universal stress UspA family protein